MLTQSDTDYTDSEFLKDKTPLSAAVFKHLVGNYRVVASTSLFRGQITMKSANSVISLYSYEAETFAVLNHGCDTSNVVYLSGRTYDPASQQAGTLRLSIAANAGGNEICQGLAPTIPHVNYTGVYGSSKNALSNSISLTYVKPLQSTGNFYIIGHHGCRTIDNCGASENSLEGIKFAGYLGANAVEIDVQLSKDGIPFLYHDDNFNSRLVNGPFCIGDIQNFTMLEIKIFCRLKYGEVIPTLNEAMSALMTDDTIKMVWIDPKNTTALGSIVILANQYAAKAAALGKTLEILIDLPDEDYANAWLAAPGYATTSCLTEYSAPATLYLGCRGYAPRYTLGPDPANASTMHSTGKLILYWTINDKSFFPTYMGYGGADGIDTDRPFLLYSLFQQ